jgi:predicted Holliday junction resolvase-like endonuclease
MDATIIYLLVILFFLLIGYLIYLRNELNLQRQREADAIAEAIEMAKPELCKSAIQSSRRVRLGLVWEQWLPFFSTFPIAPEHCRFLGSPIDFIAFNGLETEDGPVEVVLVEIKTGNARLTPRQKRIRDAVRAGKVKWMEVRIPEPE